jgi:hypothetical protein
MNRMGYFELESSILFVLSKKGTQERQSLMNAHQRSWRSKWIYY